MAKKSQKSKADNKKAEEVQQEPERSRNIAIATGIAIAVILGLLAFAFFVSSASDSASDSNTSVSTTSTASNSSDTDDSTDEDDQDEEEDTDNETDEDEEAQTPAGDPSERIGEGEDDLPARYREVAASGDSISVMSRRAMHTYLIDADKDLTTPRRLYFEVTLTNANNPEDLIPVGEVREFKTSQMNTIYDEASNLTSQQLSAWNNLASGVGYE